MPSVSSSPDRPVLPTIRDVARLAGVAKTTASDALQGKGRVSVATRAKVLSAAEVLGYRPHAGARDLTLRRSEVLGLLVGDLFDPFVSELTGHLEHHASKHGLKVLLATAGFDLEDTERALTHLVEQRVAALVLVAFGEDDETVRRQVGRTPVVSLASSGPGLSIGIDDLTGGLLAVDHLLNLGHTRIGYLSGAILPRKVDATRYAGYRAAMRGKGLQAESSLRCKIGDRASADRLGPLRELLTGPNRPTAVFAASDVLAIDLMGCAAELGLSVPKDLSIVGFDDIQFASLPMIALTTVAQPAEELAALGVNAALQMLAGESAAESIMLEPRLVVRGSTTSPVNL